MTRFEDAIIKSVKNFKENLCRINSNVVNGIYYIDLVSVEIGEGKEYTVFWFGPDNKFLKRYEDLINNYFQDKKSISLLFITINDLDNNSIHVLFDNKSFKNSNPEQIEFDEAIIKKVILDKAGHTIEKAEVDYHIQKWIDGVIKPINVQCASFSKIKFKIGQSEYFAAIWVGYQLAHLEPAECSCSKFRLNKESSLLIEKFLLQHSLDVIANNQLIKIKNHATKAATSRIINRNYAHHIGSHVSHRATADKIFERIYGDYTLDQLLGNSVPDKDLVLKSIVEMENRLTRYKDERNEFISGIDSNTHPVPVFFYKDIIQPFIENSLLMDNIAKSEGICWESEDPSKNDGKVKADGISKLRIRVFYHKDLINKPEIQTVDPLNKQQVNKPNKPPVSIKGFCCEKDVPCMHKNNDQGVDSDRLSLAALGLDNNWCEMMAFYDLDGNKQQTCIHRLPYFKKLTPGGDTFYHDIDYSLDDIEVAIQGTLGAQSIYSLLENLIRNTAKHGYEIGNSLPVNIIIKVSPRKNRKHNPGADFYNFEITSNVITITEKKQLKKIKEALTEQIDVETKALGFADMRINACLLAFREINQTNLDKSIIETPVYPKYSATTSCTNKSVGYSMLLTKPCKIVFVGKKFNDFSKHYSKWENKGIRQYDTAEACIKALGDMPRAFQFAVVQESVLDNPDNCDLLLKSLPWRVLVVSDGEQKHPTNVDATNVDELINQRRVTRVNDFDLGENPNADDLLEKCWDAWLRNRWKEPFALHMYFEKSEELEVRYLAATPNKSGFTVNIIKRKDRDNQFKLAEGFNVFYDRHGKYVGFIAAAIEREKNDYSRISWESFDKNNPDFDIIANDKLTHPKISFSKLIESGVHKILVIDERAREAGIKSHPDDWLGQESDADQYSIFAAASRVFIADSFVINGKEVLVDTAKTQKDNAQSTGNGAEQNENDNSLLSVLLEKKSLTYGGKLKDRCPDTNARNFCKFDTLIIHRTMLSKVFYISKEENYNLFKNLDQNFPNIIVTTGGGTLTYDDIKIMNRIRIMPFSTVRKFLLNSATAKNCITNLI